MDTWKACLGCGLPGPGPRCPDCQAEADTRTTARRGGAHARGYTGQWGRRAAQVRREEPACSVCDTTEDLTVDHILAKAAGGTDHRDNLTTMCRAHNSSKGHRR